MSIELIRSRNLKARKSHPCSYCRQPVAQRGEVYVRDTFVSDGRIYDWLTCPACVNARSKVWDYVYDHDEGIGPEEFIQWATEFPDDPDAAAFVARLGLA